MNLSQVPKPGAALLQEQEQVPAAAEVLGAVLLQAQEQAPAAGEVLGAVLPPMVA